MEIYSTLYLAFVFDFTEQRDSGAGSPFAAHTAHKSSSRTGQPLISDIKSVKNIVPGNDVTHSKAGLDLVTIYKATILYQRRRKQKKLNASINKIDYRTNVLSK